MSKHNTAIVYFFASAGFLSLGVLQAYSPPPPQSSYRPQSNSAPQQASGREEMAYVESYDRPGYRYNDQYNDQSYYYQQNGHRGYNDQASNNQSPNNQPQIKDIDRYDVRPNHPMTDWDYKESWQYNKKDFFQGKTQPETYRENHPYGYGGIGYDADPEYLRMEQMEKDYYHQKQQLDNLLSNSEKGSHNNQNGQNKQLSTAQNSPQSNQRSLNQNNDSQQLAEAESDKDSGSDGEIAATDQRKSKSDQRRSTRERKNRKAYQNPRIIPPTKKPDQ